MLLRHRFPSKTGGRPVREAYPLHYSHHVLATFIASPGCRMHTSHAATAIASLRAGVAGPGVPAHCRSADVQSQRQAARLPSAGALWRARLMCDLSTTAAALHSCACSESFIRGAYSMQVQVYATPAAFDQDPAAFHRTTFLFISPQANNC